MRSSIRCAGLVGLLLGWSMSGTAYATLSQCAPKVDNFVLFVDQSGSMYQQHAETGEVKAVMAKEVLRQLNATIPEAGYKSALYAFAPFETVFRPFTYSQAALGRAIERIPDSQPVAVRLTPMANGFDSLHPEVSALTGKTAIIMLSDGDDNAGNDPIEAARAVIGGTPDGCIHVISFADTEHGHEVNAAIAKLGHGCQLVEGTDLARDAAKREQFVRDIFCGQPVAQAKRRIVLRGVNFDFDKATIRPEGRPVLEEGILALKEAAGVHVSVEGHTDAVGSDAYNQALSERRADAVADFMHTGGIARSRMSTVGFGESKPVASNETEDGRAQNRRVEFRIDGQ